MARQMVPRYKAIVLTPRRPPEDDKFHEECALFGIYGTNDAAAHTALGLHALQHRGQEASGIVTFDGAHFYNHRAAGLVGDIFSDQTVIKQAQGLQRDRPQSLRHDRRLVRPQHPADLRRLRFRRPGAGPQRQPHQRLPAAQGAGADRLPVPVDHRHRGDQPPDRPLELLDRGRPRDRCAGPGEGRLFAADADQRGAARRARPDGRAAALHRPPRRCLDPDLRELRARHPRRPLRARRRAGRDRDRRRHRPALDQAVGPGSRAGSASSSTSTSPAPTARSRASASTRRARRSAPSSPRKAPSRPT